MFKKGDFHTHTNASDGKLSPRELITLAKEVNLQVIAVTDHDTTAGLKEACEWGKLLNIQVIKGIELSTLYNGESIHILGYFRDDSYKEKAFQDFLKEITDFRVTRAKKIVQNLKKYFNIEIDYKKILEEAEGIIARPHIAKAIIEAGYDYSWEYIFGKFLHKDSPAYVANKHVSIEEGIKLLKSFNALVVLAHPVLINNSSIQELLKFPFDGIEAIYFKNSKEDTEMLLNVAKEHNLLVTAGSDYHGISKKDSGHAECVGDIFLTGENLDRLLKELA